MALETNVHDDYYHKLKHEKIHELARLVDEAPAETCRELEEQLAFAIEHGTAKEIASAVISVIDIRHAYHELKERKHDAMGVK